MIRYKDKIFEQYSICPATGDIFDAKTGEVQKTRMRHGRPVFKGMALHQIMAHTFYGYKPGYDVHHRDENKLNNSLSNLVYLTRGEHARLHSGKHLSEETRLKISAANKGKIRSEETRLKISEGMKGKNKGKNKGKPRSEETRAKISVANKGKHLSEETKAKISTVMKGNSWNKGKPRSEETRAKISEAMRRKHAEIFELKKCLQ